MPWELLTSFRRPVRRQPTSDPPLQNTTPQVQREPSVRQLPIARKILQDPNAFLEADGQDVTPVGLTPSTRLPSGDGSGRARSRPRPIDPPSEPPSERSEPPPGSSAEISPRTQSRFTTSRISKVAAGGEWSTFGRKREHRLPDIAIVSGRTSPPSDQTTPHSPSPTKDSKHFSADSTASVFTPSRVTNPSSATQEIQSSPGSRSARQSPEIRSSSKRSSPTDTMSSKRHPRTPQGQSSYTTPVAAHATSSAMNLTTPVNRQPAIDSPHTFGYPTPPDNHVEYRVASPSPLPPLPPLDHPELAAVLSSRRQSTSTSQPALSVFRDRSNTLPASGRPSRKDDLFTSLSVKMARSLRHRSSPPEAKQDLSTAMAEHHETRPADAPERRRRARTVSGDAPRRRSSADWSSYQASVGVNSHANQAWPAEVSREILRLSLGTSGPDSAPGSSEKRKQGTRGKSADPDHKPNRSALSPSFLPFPRPSPPNSPSPLTASATLAGAHKSMSRRYHLTHAYIPDGRELIPSRSHSLRFDLGNRRDSKQRTRLSMAEVKRSSSVIETRNGRRNNEAGGATYPSLGLSDPEAPQSLLHPSLAPTPSQSLLSGRISPVNDPMVSSVPEEPSTPTPAPRQLSDKSKGKRKAEDTIDVTPPEQKKEGQRPTFLLPAGTRSKCQSHWFTSQTALSALAKIETKVSASQTPRTLHRHTTASAFDCRQLPLSLPLCNHDHRLFMIRHGPQIAITTLRPSPAVPAVASLHLAHLRALRVLHPLALVSLPLPAQPESTNDINPCLNFRFR